MNLKKMKEAFSTLSQAVKYSERNWKIWSNLMSVSLSVKQFSKYFECIERIVKLGNSELITAENLQKIIKIFQYKQES